MGQKASSFYNQGTKMDVIRSSDTGEMEIWQSTAGPDVFFLRKNIDQLKRSLPTEAIRWLVQRESLLPRTIVPIMRMDGQLVDLSDCTEIVTDLTANNLQLEIDRLNRENKSMNELDVYAIFGALVLTSMALEKNTDFHRSICLKNIFLVGNSIYLLNPYIKDSHISKSIDAVVRPAINMGSSWKPEYMWNQEERSRAATYDRDIEKIIRNHREILYEMVLSIGIVLMSTCVGKLDDYFLNSDGSLDSFRIDEAISVDSIYQGNRRSVLKAVIRTYQKSSRNFVQEQNPSRNFCNFDSSR